MEVFSWWKMRFSYRNATILICILNVVAAILLLRGFFGFADKRVTRAKQPNVAEMIYITESELIRRSMEPTDLIKRIKEIEEEAYTIHEMDAKQVPKQTIAGDLSKRLNDLRAINDANSFKALEEWRKRKMERARQREFDRNSTITAP